MKKLLEDAARRSIAYRSAIESRSVAPSAEAVANLCGFDESLSVDGESAAETLALLDDLGSPAAMGMTGPRFFGFVIGGSTPVTLGANWIAGAWDQNAVMHAITPAVSIIERKAIEWLVDLLQLPAGSGAGLVTGATVANFTALVAARDQVLRKAGWDCRADGLFGAPEVTVIVGAEAHPTLLKSLSLAGFGANRVKVVDVDSQGRMLASALPKVDGPAIACVQAGNINTGAFDPVGDICEQLAGHNAWVHVDGAFGLWAAACPKLEHLCEGMNKADSWATDAHKWLNVPYDCGIAFVKEPETLHSAMAIDAPYLVTNSTQRNPSDYTPELSRRARGVEVWAALRTLGRSGLINMIEGCCERATQFAEELGAADFEILNDVVLNQVLVSFGDRETTLAVTDAVKKDGTCWCGSTVWQGQTAMRISVSNWSTTARDVTESVAAISRVARAIIA